MGPPPGHALCALQVSTPQSLLTTHFGIKAVSVDQKATCIQNLLIAAADRLNPGNRSWSDAVQAVLLSPAPSPLQEHPCKLESGKAAEPESTPPQTAASIHVAVTATFVCLEASPAVTGNHKQSGVTLAGGTDSSLPAADATATATAAVVDTTAGDAARTADDAAAGDLAVTAADAATTADLSDDAVAADAAATPADHSAAAIAAAADIDAAAAIAWASQVVSGSDTVAADEETTPCHLMLQANSHTAPFGEGVGQPQHCTTEQTDTSAAASSRQAHPQQMEPSAAQLPALPASHQPALQPHHRFTPASVPSSATGAQMSITAPSSVIISAASSPLLLHGCQLTQLALSSGLAAPPVPAQHASLPERFLQQRPSIAVSPLQTDKIANSKSAGAQELQMQLLHGSKPIWKQHKTADAAQPGSTGLLACHTHCEHDDSALSGHPSTMAASWVTACQDTGPLEAVSSCSQHSAPHWSTSTQPPGSKTSLHMQQSSPSFQTAQPQQQLPPQLLGPASQKLQHLLLQLERTAALRSTVHTLNPASSPNHAPSFPSVLLQDPGLLVKVQSTLQECAQEGSQGLDQAQSQARYAFDAVDAS